MPIKKVFTIEPGKYDSVRKAIINDLDGILLNFPLSQNKIESYYIGKTGCSLFYNGEDAIAIGNSRLDRINETKSELEKKSGVELKSH